MVVIFLIYDYKGHTLRLHKIIIEMSDVSNLQKKIENKLGKPVFNSIRMYVSRFNPTLWGQQQPHNYLDNMLIFTLAKICRKKSYQWLIENVHTHPKLNAKSLGHNIPVLVDVIRMWAEGQIILGTQEDWDHAAANVAAPERLSHVRFWIDSTDFKIARRKGTGPRTPHWSAKLRGPGRRYMVLCTGDGIIRKLWMAYSPKMYDSDKIKHHKDFFDGDLGDVGVVGDNHFLAAREHFRFCDIVAPSRAKPNEGHGKKRKTTDVGPTEEKRNNEIRRLRARVETPFANMKKKVKSLAHPFYEDEDMHDGVVIFAAGVHNFVHQRNL